MKNALLVILMLGMMITMFFFGRGCADDSNVDEIVRRNAIHVERLQAERDSLRTLRERDAEAIETYYQQIEEADSARRVAENRSEAALALIAKIPSYETLTSDQLATRADSLFRARAVE